MIDLVTVIVITFNSEKTIIETLNSIKKQSHKNIELIISDDSSKDKTIGVIKQWLEENKSRFINVQLIQSPTNTGVPSNCNRGLKFAKSEWVKLLAGDDCLAENSIEMFLSYAISSMGKKIIYQSQVTLFGDINETAMGYIDFSFKLLQTNKVERQYKNLLKYNFIVAPAIGLLQKRELDKIGGFDERFPAFEDYPLWIKLSQMGYSFVPIFEPLVCYRISNKSISNGKNHFLEISKQKFYKMEKRNLLVKSMMFIELIKQDARFYRRKHYLGVN